MSLAARAWVLCLLAATGRGLREQDRPMSWNLASNPARKPFHRHAALRLHGRLGWRLAVPSVLALAGALLVISPAAPARAACANPVVCENQLPGTPQSTWDVSSYSSTIEGFADPFSVNIGGSINFK